MCQLNNANGLLITYASTNTGITCAPACLSSITSGNVYVPSTVCPMPTNQDNALCGLIAATNIQTISGYSQWSCTTLGISSVAACTAPIWAGVACSGSNVVSITAANIGLSGSYLIINS